jgi:hypothetical protein
VLSKSIIYLLEIWSKNKMLQMGWDWIRPDKSEPNYLISRMIFRILTMFVVICPSGSTLTYSPSMHTTLLEGWDMFTSIVYNYY